MSTVFTMFTQKIHAKQIHLFEAMSCNGICYSLLNVFIYFNYACSHIILYQLRITSQIHTQQTFMYYIINNDLRKEYFYFF